MELEVCEDVLQSLAASGLDEVEVYWKRGRSRRVLCGPRHRDHQVVHEEGWAVRAGHERCAFFASGSGAPSPGGPWPEPDGHPMRLPAAWPVPPWRPEPALDAPLIGELDGHAFLDAVERALAGELPGARLRAALLEDGSSEGCLVSSRGVRAVIRHRLASLHLEAATAELRCGASLDLAEREARRFHPLALARRLADLLLVRQRGTAPERDRGEVLLAPAVAARVLAALSPLLCGPQAAALAAPLAGRHGRIASTALTVTDDGRLAGGVLAAPVDGEGVPTRELNIVAEGALEQPLLAWWQCRGGAGRFTGCSRRASYRDLPAPGPTHLYVRPCGEASVASLLTAVTRGYYFLDTEGEIQVRWQDGTLAIPVCGFSVQGGQATSPVAGAWLVGTVGTFLHGIQAVGRDLAFFPLNGMIGAPSLLVAGLEVRGGTLRGGTP